MDFIEDDFTRNMLSDLYEQKTAFAKTLDERESMYHNQIVSPVLIKLFESINTSLVQSTSGNIPLNYELLKTNEEYKSMLRTNIGNRNKTLIWIRMSLNLMEELDRRLQMELKR